MLVWNSDVDGEGICVRIVLLITHLCNCFFCFFGGGACFAYDKIVINNNNKNPVTWPSDLVPSLWIERSEVQTRSKATIYAVG